MEIAQEIIVQPIISKMKESILISEERITGEVKKLDGFVEILAREMKRQNEKLGEMTDTRSKEG